MRTKVHILAALTLTLSVGPLALQAQAAPAPTWEHKIKAAFLYNFINFVDWPEDKIADNNKPITIGVIGSRDFLKALEPIKQKKVRGRKIAVSYFPDYDKLKKPPKAGDPQWSKKIETLKTCHILFLCVGDFGPIESSGRIIRALKGSPVLTVGETEGFLESSGIINFLVEDERVRFEINNTTARQAKLKIRSKLLRLAKRVVGEGASNGTRN
jgi:hypothetical protein